VEMSEWLCRTKEGRKLFKKRVLNTIQHVPRPREYVESILSIQHTQDKEEKEDERIVTPSA